MIEWLVQSIATFVGMVVADAYVAVRGVRRFLNGEVVNIRGFAIVDGKRMGNRIELGSSALTIVTKILGSPPDRLEVPTAGLRITARTDKGQVELIDREGQSIALVARSGSAVVDAFADRLAAES